MVFLQHLELTPSCFSLALIIFCSLKNRSMLTGLSPHLLRWRKSNSRVVALHDLGVANSFNDQVFPPQQTVRLMRPHFRVVTFGPSCSLPKDHVVNMVHSSRITTTVDLVITMSAYNKLLIYSIFFLINFYLNLQHCSRTNTRGQWWSMVKEAEFVWKVSGLNPQAAQLQLRYTEYGTDPTHCPLLTLSLNC